MTSFIIKIIACISMLFDHIGFVFFPGIRIFRIIGRLALPLFAFQLGVGFKNTKNKEKYILRMLLLGIVSQIPYRLLLSNLPVEFDLNICFTFTLGLLCLYSITNIENIYLKFTSIALLLTLGYFIPVDYGIYALIMIISFYLFQEDKFLLCMSYTYITILYFCLHFGTNQLYSIIALIPILFYNKKAGKKVKWLFYIFYPLHFFIIYLFYVSKIF